MSTGGLEHMVTALKRHAEVAKVQERGISCWDCKYCILSNTCAHTSNRLAMAKQAQMRICDTGVCAFSCLCGVVHMVFAAFVAFVSLDGSLSAECFNISECVLVFVRGRAVQQSCASKPIRSF